MQRKEGTFAIGLGAVRGNILSLTEELDKLHVNERNRFEEFKFDKRKHSYLLGRLASKYAISNLITDQGLHTISVTEGIFQFPVVEFLTSSHLQLSISHCDDIGLALAYPEAHPVGIDIEEINEKSTDALGSIVNDAEVSLLQHLPLSNVEGMSLIWTAKEALSKIFRTGMMLSFSTLELSTIKSADEYLISEFKHAGQYKAYSFIYTGYAISIVIPGRSETDIGLLIRSLKNLTSDIDQKV
ncbi:MAG: 4'-phosphopantetheinyl transferase superfamily protein [Cyclobacteriaceae bacterium]